MKHSITHCTVPRETFIAVRNFILQTKEPLDHYIQQLFWWNKRINLISRDVSRETLIKHIAHSLILNHFAEFQRSEYIIDAGTGGGLPGIPLAIANPQKHFLLNDIVSKKILAVKQIAKELNLENTSTFDHSVSQIKQQEECLLISKHAFKIGGLLQLSRNIPWTSLIFYKGLNFKEELNSVESPLNIYVYDLAEHANDTFFRDKAIIEIKN